MKAWAKILMWFGLGAGVGFFAGQQFGYNKAKKEDEGVINEAYAQGHKDGYNYLADLSEVKPVPVTEAIEMYRGEDEPDTIIDGPVEPNGEEEDSDDEEWLEEPMMPDETDFHIPQQHPTQMSAELVTEEEYDNRGDLDEEHLLYFEGDEVLFNTRTNTILTDDEVPNAIGHGTLMEFRAGPGDPKETIYVINEVLGTRFRIERMDDSFCDAVEGSCPPDEDE